MKNVQKLPKKHFQSPSRPPLLRLPTTFTRWQVGPGLPHILFFEGRTHILTFGPPKGVPEWKNHLKTAYSLLCGFAALEPPFRALCLKIWTKPMNNFYWACPGEGCQAPRHATWAARSPRLVRNPMKASCGRKQPVHQSHQCPQTQ